MQAIKVPPFNLEITMRVERLPNSALNESKLPDGSRIVIDPQNEAVIALNPTAGAAWDACSQPTTLGDIAAEIGTDPEIAEDAIFQLREKKLVVTSEAPQPSRRTFIAGMAAVPVVAAMSMAEQKAFANSCGSFERNRGGDRDRDHWDRDHWDRH